jgi:capsule polysaccharide export protein KpsE/RkpR
VANDGSLDMQMATAASEEAVKQLKALRAEDANKMQRLNTERASLQQKAEDLESRLSSAVHSAEKAEQAATNQRYELHSQLTEVREGRNRESS